MKSTAGEARSILQDVLRHPMMYGFGGGLEQSCYVLCRLQLQQSDLGKFARSWRSARAESGLAARYLEIEPLYREYSDAVAGADRRGCIMAVLRFGQLTSMFATRSAEPAVVREWSRISRWARRRPQHHDAVSGGLWALTMASLESSVDRREVTLTINRFLRLSFLEDMADLYRNESLWRGLVEDQVLCRRVVDCARIAMSASKLA